ncbi:MAG: hypothetical protein M1165_02535 [Candidatus Pacearchaeota archaeon]|nr:hypothetical protein [Candidatus Pacearchaeota archaeon]MDE1848821.1 hypothetical protein [Nanoarchaeota archaeon]
MGDLNFEPAEPYDLETDNLAYRHSHRPEGELQIEDPVREAWIERVKTSTDKGDIAFYTHLISLKDMANEKMAGQHRNN